MLALLAALVGPYFVDWAGYRAEFEREASSVLGRPVTVEGDVTARLLPFPSVSFTDVRVGGETPDVPAMTIESFSMDAELAPFLRGEILIFDMRLVRPHARILIAEDGIVDWAVRPSTRFDPSQITLEKLSVVEGKVTLAHGPSGREHLLTEINADIAARTLAGPWRLDGSARIDGMLTALSVSTGAVSDDGGMRLRVRAVPERYPLVLETDGEARLIDGAARYDGTFRLDARDNEQATLRGGDDGTPGVQTPEEKETPADYRFSGRFDLDHRRLDVAEFRLETGPKEDPYTADGTALLDLSAEPRFLIQATGAQVRIDEALGAEGVSGSVSLGERIAALRAALQTLPRPTIRGTVDVDLPAIVAGDTTIRNVRLSAEPAEGGWTVKALSAMLPGRTTLEAEGFLASGDAFGFKGKLLVAVAQPSGFAAWIARDVDDAIRRLPAAGFSADVDLTEKRQDFRDLELVLGNTTFRGSLRRLVREGVDPAMIARLEGDALDVEGMAAFASLFVSDSGVAHFGGHDIDFDLDAGPVSLAGITAEKVDAALRLRGAQLEVDRLAITGLEGASISATATIRDFGPAPAGNFDASVLSPDLGALVRLAAERFPDNAMARAIAERAASHPELLSDAQVDMVGSLVRKGNGASDVALSAQGHAGENDFTFTGNATDFSGDLGAAQLSLRLDAESANAAQLLAFYGLPVFDLGMAGEGKTSLALDGVLESGADVRIELKSPLAEARFDGVARTGGLGLTAKGKARISGSDLEPWLVTVGASLPGMGIGLPMEMEADAAYEASGLTLSGLKGVVAEQAVSGDLTGAWSDGPPRISGSLHVEGFDIALAAGLVLGAQALDGEGDPWPDTPFAQSAAAPFTGEIDLAFDTLDVGLFEAAEKVRMKARLDASGLSLSRISAEMLGGTAEGLIELRNDAGTALLSGQMSLKDVDASAVLGASGAGGKADVSAAITASGKSLGGLAAALAGSGTAAFTGLTVPGIAPGALPGILARADEIGREIDAEKVAAFAPALVSAGTFEADDFDVPFTVAGGMLRTPPIFLKARDSAINLEVKADFGSDEIALQGAIAYDPGDEALVGSEPTVGLTIAGPIGGAVRSLETAPLAQFLTQRALEREQARVEAMQAELLEKQRLRREVRYYAQLVDFRRLAAEEEARRKAEEEARLKAEEEARLKAEEEARRVAEEARLKAEEAARLQAAEESRRRAAEEAEAEARRKAEEAARKKAEAEASRKAAAEAKRKADEDARRRASEEEARRAAEEAQKKADAAQRLRKEDEARLRAEEEARLKAEQEALLSKPGPASEVRREPLPPPTQPQRPPAGDAPNRVFDAPSIEDFLKSLGPR